jgi:hypothetical protein
MTRGRAASVRFTDDNMEGALPMPSPPAVDCAIVFPDVLSDDAAVFGKGAASDDAAVTIVLSASSVDDALHQLLLGFLIDSTRSERLLSHRGGALGTLSAKADAAYCLGLIPKLLYLNLTHIAELRNTVAHHAQRFTFQHPDIVRICRMFAIPEQVWSSLPAVREHPAERAPISPECRFHYAVAATLADLERRVQTVAKTPWHTGDMWSECV